MHNSTHVLKLAIPFLLLSCTAIDTDKTPASHEITRDALNIVDRFENTLAEKLLHLAFQDIQAANNNEQFQIVDTHRRKLKKSLDISRLSPSNQRQLRLFEHLWQTERSKSDMAKTGAVRPYTETLKLETSISSNAVDLSLQAYEKLSKLHAKIRLLTETPVQVSLESLFETSRNNPENYLPNTHAGRQKYLDLMVDSLIKIERLLPAVYSGQHGEFILAGDENRKANQLFIYDRTAKTLNIDLGDMTQLPLYEIDSVAAYYGIPGMHTISSIRSSEIQSLISLPGYAAGWAAYITSSLNRGSPVQLPDSELMRSYFEAMIISLAVADIGLHSENWSVDQATEFVISSSPYPVTRLKNSILLAARMPGVFSTPLLARLQFETLQEQSKELLQHDFVLSEFQLTILNPGLLPFSELQKVVADWTKQNTPANQTHDPNQ